MSPADGSLLPGFVWEDESTTAPTQGGQSAPAPKTTAPKPPALTRPDPLPGFVYEDRLQPAQAQPAPEGDYGVGDAAGDLTREFGGALTSATGYGLRGVGEMARLAASPIVSAVNTIAGDDVLSDPVNPLAAPAGWLERQGEAIQEGESAHFKKAMQESTPQGDIFKGEISLGTNPGFLGYAGQLANVAGQVAPVLGAAVLTRGQSLAGQLGFSTGTAAAQGGGAAAQQEGERIRSMSQPELDQLPGYIAMLDRGMQPDQAREQLALATARSTFVRTAPISAASGLILGGGFTRPVQNVLKRVAGEKFVPRIATAIAAEAPAEGAQEVAEQAAQTHGANVATGEQRSLTEGSAANAVLGALGGGLGGVATGIARPKGPIEARPKGPIERAADEAPSVNAQPQAADTPNAETPNSDPSEELAPVPPAPWMQDGVQTRSPSIADIRLALHQLADQRDETGLVPSASAVTKVWGIPNKVLMEQATIVGAARKAGMTTADAQRQAGAGQPPPDTGQPPLDTPQADSAITDIRQRSSSNDALSATQPQAMFRVEPKGEKGILVHGDPEAARARLAEAGFNKKGRQVKGGGLRFDVKDRGAIETALGLGAAQPADAAANAPDTLSGAQTTPAGQPETETSVQSTLSVPSNEVMGEAENTPKTAEMQQTSANVDETGAIDVDETPPGLPDEALAAPAPTPTPPLGGVVASEGIEREPGTGTVDIGDVGALRSGGTVATVAVDAEGEAGTVDQADDPFDGDERAQTYFNNLANEVGWDQIGGRIIREFDDGHGLKPEVVGRTTWIGKPGPDGESGFWRMRPEKGGKINEKGALEALAKAAKGEPLNAKEGRFVEYARQTAKQYADSERKANAEFERDQADMDDEAVQAAREAFAADNVAPADEAEALSMVQWTERAHNAGATSAQIIDITWDGTPSEKMSRMARLAFDLENSRDTDAGTIPSDNQEDITTPGTGAATAGAEAPGFELASQTQPEPSTEPEAPQQQDLIAPPTTGERVRGAIEAKDAERDGRTGTGRTDMLAGDGALFAGTRPEQTLIPDQSNKLPSESFSVGGTDIKIAVAAGKSTNGTGDGSGYRVVVSRRAGSIAIPLQTIGTFDTLEAAQQAVTDERARLESSVAGAVNPPRPSPTAPSGIQGTPATTQEGVDRTGSPQTQAKAPPEAQAGSGQAPALDTSSSEQDTPAGDNPPQASAAKKDAAAQIDFDAISDPRKRLRMLIPQDLKSLSADDLQRLDDTVFERGRERGRLTGTERATRLAIKAELRRRSKVPGTLPAGTSTDQIEDFGEKLGGARKDQTPSLAKDLTEDDIASQPLSKIWPATEIDDITDPFAAALAHAARGEVPAKPRKGWKLRRWVEKVQSVRGLAKHAMDGTLTPQELANRKPLADFAAKVTLLQGLDRANWSRIGDVHESPNAYGFDDEGQKFPSPHVSVAIDGRWSTFNGSGKIEDAIAEVKARLAAAPAAKKMQFEVRGRTGAYFINKKGDSEYRRLKEFTDSKEALAYLRAHYDDLVQAWEKVKERDNVTKADMRNKSNRPRVGTDYRNGKDVTPEQFAETFGFRGVEFGNWVKQGKNAKERQGLLNQSYDALMDLASLVGVPPKAMSLNGTLGLGLGSRGHGWASAHFEPTRLVINLTKTRGAGALAHEWFHALDNYFARSRGAPEFSGAQGAFRKSAFVTYRPEPMMVNTKIPSMRLSRAELAERRRVQPNTKLYAPEQWEVDSKHPEGVRPVVEKAFAELVTALNESPMADRARKIDKRATDGYWSRIIERAARSFENYVIARMESAGIANDYLANVRQLGDFNRDPERYPYLKPEEVKPVAEAFDNLFNTIETRTGEDGNVTLFKRRSAPGRSIRSVVELDAVANRITAGWRNAPTIRTVGGFADLPPKLREKARKEGSDGSDIAAAFHDGEVWLVASHPDLGTDAGVEHAVFHEVWGHYGLRMVFGKDTMRALTRMATAMGGIPGILRYAKKYDIDLSTYVKGFRGNDALSRGERQAMLLDELAAHIAQNGTPTMKQRLREYLGALKAWLRDHGFPSLSRMSDLDLAHVLKRARDAVVNGKPVMPGDTGSSFQRVPPERTPSTAETAEAKRQYGEVERTHAEVLRAHDEDGKPLPAPNGKPSNLTRGQWIQVRTPNFKRWFGDWEALARWQQIQNLPSVEAAPKALTAADAKGVYQSLGNARLPDGTDVQIVRGIFGKLKGHKDHDKLFRIIPKLKELLANSQLAYFETERNPASRQNIEGFSNYVAKALIDGSEYYVRFSVQEARIDRHQLHNAALSDVEITEAAAGASLSDISTSATTRDDSLDKTLVRWMRSVKATAVSKVTNPDTGEPLVAYHGTTEVFDAFDPKRTGLRTKNTYGDGAMFFTSNPAAASAYAIQPFHEPHPLDQPNVLPIFLSLRNPLEIDADGASWKTVGEQVAGAEKLGHDGVIVRNVLDHASVVTSLEEGPIDVFAAFHPEHVKSSSANIGTFSDRPQINFSLPESVAAPFYSALLRAVETAKGAPKKGSPPQWKQWLDGAQRRGELKQAERDWLGVDAWLDAHDGPVTRDDLAGFVRGNQVQIKDVVFGERKFRDQLSARRWESLSKSEQLAVPGNDYGDYGGFVVYKNTQPVGIYFASSEHDAISYAMADTFDVDPDRPDSDAKFEGQVLPGTRENYRELLLTLPARGRASNATVVATGEHRGQRFVRFTLDDLTYVTQPRRGESDADAIARRLADNIPLVADERSRAFQSSHFDQPNILAHVRFNERKDVDGNKVLFIEELQSDWHQAGRTRGYGDTVEMGWTARNPDGGGTVGSFGSRQEALDWINSGVREDVRNWIPAEVEISRKKGVPDAPFKNTDQWAMLAFKRMARYAAENGFDSIAWTTGEQQAERYDLSKKIESVTADEYTIAGDRKWLVKAETHAGGNVSPAHYLTDAELAETVGKDLAETIIADGGGSYSGLDLKVGGDGMRGFYDKILPSAVNKWAKKLSGKVGEATIKTKGYDLGDTQTVHNLELTPAMTAAALGGQPLFRMGDGTQAASSSDAAHLRRVHAIIQPVLARWGKDQPQVRVLHSADLLPREARQHPRYREANGFYDGTTVYLVAPNLKSRRAVLKTLAHESIGHYGIDRIVKDAYGPDAWHKIEQSFARLDREGKGGKRMQDVLAEVHRRYDQAGQPPDAHTFASEAFAVMAEHGVSNALMDRLITAIRQYLRKIMPNLKLSRQEMRQLLVRSEAYLEGEGIAAYRGRVARVQALAFDLAPQVGSLAFNRWFGKSKVVNAKGEPMVLYHGTGEGFWAFDDARLGTATGHMTAPLGHFFAESRAKAERYAENASQGVPADERVVDVYASIEKPKAMTVDEFLAIDSFDEARALKARLQAEGFDGIHLTDIGQWVVFSNTQVKSASQNQGTFDASNPDMRFSLPSFVQQVRDWFGSPNSRGRTLDMGRTPAVLRMMGVPDFALQMPAGVMRKIASGKSGNRAALDERTIRRLPEAIDAPMAVFKSNTTRGSYVVLTDLLDADGQPVLVTIKPDEVMGNAKVNVVTSAYGKGGVAAWAARERKAGRMRYLDSAKGQGTLEVSSPALNSGTEPSSRSPSATSILTPDDLSNFRTRQRGNFSLPPDPDQNELADALFGGESSAPTGTAAFSHPEATVDTIDKVLAQPDADAWERAKAWMAGKWEDIKPATLGFLQMRHLLELAEDISALKGANQYGDEMQAMDADRNQLLMGDPHAADKPEDMLAQGAAPLTEKMRKYAFQNGMAGLFGKKKPEAKRLFKLMHDATIEGSDPSGEYKPLQMQDARGRWSPWTPEKVAERLKQISEQISGRPGDDKTVLQAEAKRLKNLAARERARAKAWPELVRRYNALSPEAKTIYKNTRDWYAQHQEATEQALLKRIELMKVPETYRRSLKDKVRLQFESQRVEGVYFPLDRNGEYWLSVVDPDGVPGFVMFENAAEQAAAEKKLTSAHYVIESKGRRDNTYRAKDAPSGTFINDIIQVMKKSGAPEAVQNEVYQMFLRSLPEMSMRKRHIHRKAIPGYSEDALRAFAKNSFHGSHQLARLRHSHKLQLMMENMEEAVNNARKGDARDEDGKPITARQTARADSLMAELKRRHDWILSPKDSNLANMMTGIGFMYYLGLSPASALVNLTQGAQVTLPVLGAKHGWDKAGAALAKSTAAALRTGGNIKRTLKGEELQAYEDLERRGDIERTQVHTIAGVAEGNMLEMNPAWAKSMTIMSVMFHKAEIVNREAAGMAAYRLGRGDGMNHDEAVKYASDTINKTQFDYSNANRNRYTQGGVPKVLFQFKSYSLGMTWLLYRNAWKALKGESKEVRREALRTLTGILGMTSIFAGVIGLPIINAMAMIANAVHMAAGDDDEPWDFQTEFRAWLAEHFGEQGADLIASGAVDQLGASISTRVGLSNLWFRTADRQLEGRDAFYHFLEGLSGPMGGMAKNLFVGMQYVEDGHVWRGVERMLPTAAKNAMKGFRYASQGVNTLSGAPIVEDVSVTGSIIQALGFQPEDVADQRRINNALMNYQDFIKTRRQTLLNGYAMALHAQDSEAKKATLAKIRDFNTKWPEIAISAATIRRSLRGSARYKARAVHGMPLNRKLVGRLREDVGVEARDSP